MARIRNTNLLAGGLLAALLSLSGCGGDDGKAEAEAKAKQAAQEKSEMTLDQQLSEGAEQLAEAFSAAGKPVKTVDHTLLKAMLPEEIDGLTRTSASAERRGAMGFNVSQASAEYRTENGDGMLSLTIDDIGSASALAKLGLEWMEIEVDREDENGFERTSEYRGFRTVEKLQKYGGHSAGEMTIFVGNRFIVRMDAQDLPFEQLREVADGIDLNALAALDTSKDGD